MKTTILYKAKKSIKRNLIFTKIAPLGGGESFYPMGRGQKYWFPAKYVKLTNFQEIKICFHYIKQ